MTVMDLEMSDRDKHDLLSWAENGERTTSGQVTPTNGKRLVLIWIQILPDPDGAEGNLVSIRWNGSSANIYQSYAVGRQAEFIGAVNQKLDVILENSVKTTVNIQYKEI